MLQDAIRIYEAKHRKFAEPFRIRMHRALSWLKKARSLHVEGEVDLTFITLWISFNATYGKDLAQVIGTGDKSTLYTFLNTISRLDGSDRLGQILWREYGNPVEPLLANQYTFQKYWAWLNGDESAKDWEKSFAASKFKAQKARTDRDTVTMLSLIFDRLYTMRNQLLHGGATFGSSMNRTQIEDAIQFMLEVLPVMLEIMMAGYEHFTQWGRPFYLPVRDGSILWYSEEAKPEESAAADTDNRTDTPAFRDRRLSSDQGKTDGVDLPYAYEATRAESTDEDEMRFSDFYFSHDGKQLNLKHVSSISFDLARDKVIFQQDFAIAIVPKDESYDKDSGLAGKKISSSYIALYGIEQCYQLVMKLPYFQHCFIPRKLTDPYSGFINLNQVGCFKSDPDKKRLIINFCNSVSFYDFHKGEMLTAEFLYLDFANIQELAAYENFLYGRLGLANETADSQEA